jgi:hyperosmotically inducible periplasmic protein
MTKDWHVVGFKPTVDFSIKYTGVSKWNKVRCICHIFTKDVAISIHYSVLKIKVMKRNISAYLLMITIFATAMVGCNSKPKDPEIKASVVTALNANPQTTGLAVNVTDGVVTVNGEVKDASAKAEVTTIASDVKGVKSVQNNVTVAAPAPAFVEITADDPLTTGVKDATKDFPGVTATVNDGVITVSGELKSADWRRLKIALDGLRPKKVDAAGLKILK